MKKRLSLPSWQFKMLKANERACARNTHNRELFNHYFELKEIPGGHNLITLKHVLSLPGLETPMKSLPLKKAFDILRCVDLDSLPARVKLFIMLPNIEKPDNPFVLPYVFLIREGEGGDYFIFTPVDEEKELDINEQKFWPKGYDIVTHKGYEQDFANYILNIIYNATISPIPLIFTAHFPNLDIKVNEGYSIMESLHHALDFINFTHIAEPGIGRTPGSDKMARASLRRVINKKSSFEYEFAKKTDFKYANYLPVRRAIVQRKFIKSLKQGDVFQAVDFDYSSSDFSDSSDGE